ncbi:hypothetical protein F5Y08DRAFT_342432 [Xylaria arbuscula]|nr:hypothetical protein F5Y08DRAFT_342432 [Xylaria arbuscula]
MYAKVPVLVQYHRHFVDADDVDLACGQGDHFTHKGTKKQILTQEILPNTFKSSLSKFVTSYPSNILETIQESSPGALSSLKLSKDSKNSKTFQAQRTLSKLYSNPSNPHLRKTRPTKMNNNNISICPRPDPAVLAAEAASFVAEVTARMDACKTQFDVAVSIMSVVIAFLIATVVFLVWKYIYKTSRLHEDRVITRATERARKEEGVIELGPTRVRRRASDSLAKQDPVLVLGADNDEYRRRQKVAAEKAQMRAQQHHREAERARLEILDEEALEEDEVVVVRPQRTQEIQETQEAEEGEQTEQSQKVDKGKGKEIQQEQAEAGDS